MFWAEFGTMSWRKVGKLGGKFLVAGRMEWLQLQPLFQNFLDYLGLVLLKILYTTLAYKCVLKFDQNHAF